MYFLIPSGYRLQLIKIILRKNDKKGKKSQKNCKIFRHISGATLDLMRQAPCADFLVANRLLGIDFL